MAESNDVKALEKICTEVDEIQFNVLLSTQCIKVQSFLADKLKKQAERQNEVCSFISSANLKLKTEIKLAEAEFYSLTSAIQTIKSANVEYRKELLLLKERRSEIEERVGNGIKKYENLWIESKNKYENIPLIKTYLEVKNKCHTIQESITMLNNEYLELSAYKTNKIMEIKNLEKHNVVKLADYLINERKKILRLIQEQEYAKNKLNNEIHHILQDYPTSNKGITIMNKESKNETKYTEVTKKTWPKIQNNKENEGLLLPQIQLQNSDLDILSMKLNEIKKVDSNMPISKYNLNTKQDVVSKIYKTNNLSLEENYVSDYFKIGVKVNIESDGNKHKKHFSDKKLIHILDDIKLNKKETCNVVAQVNHNNFQSIDLIKAASENEKTTPETSQNKVSKGANPEILGKIESANQNTPSVVLPPTQFMDLTQDNHFEISNPSPSDPNETFNKLSQETKKVELDVKESKDEKQSDDNCFLNNSTESVHKMKEMILKKHNLDSSPKFVYTRNTYNPKAYKGESPNKANITSKFFDEQDNEKGGNKETNNATCTDPITSYRRNNMNTESVDPNIEIPDSNKNATLQDSTMLIKCSSPKDVDQDMTVAGLLFVHGAQSIPDSLNLSVSTAEYEESDSDFVHGIDSSLLLSPKPEILANEGHNNEAGSEGINNFLSGLRKTGMSLFGGKSDDSKANLNNQGNNFTFSFGGDDKRSRGGFFSMFH